MHYLHYLRQHPIGCVTFVALILAAAILKMGSLVAVATWMARADRALANLLLVPCNQD